MDFGNIPLKLRNYDVGIGNDGVCVHDIVADAGNDGLGIRNDGVYVRDTAANTGNDGLSGQNITMDVGNGYIRMHSKFGLDADNQWRSCGSVGTYIKDMKDPVEARPPARDCLFVVLRVEDLRHPASFAPLDDVLLDLGHSPATKGLVSEPGIRMAGPTHVVNCPIASSTD